MFTWINITAFMKILRERKMYPAILKSVIQIYLLLSTCLNEWNVAHSIKIVITNGIQQGSVVSPLLFVV